MAPSTIQAPTGSDYDRARLARRQRYRSRHTLWDVSKSRTLRSCGRGTRRDTGVEVHAVTGDDGTTRGTVTGLQSCASIWGCPVCSAHIRQARAVDIETATTAHLNGGGGVAFLTLTVRHTDRTPLGFSLGVLMDAWRRTIRGRPWQRKRDAVGLLGSVKASEVTWGRANGWHPHLHLLLFTRTPLSPDALEDLTGWLTSRWLRIIRRLAPSCTPTRAHGVRLQVVTSGAIGEYLAKVQDNGGRDRAIGLEMARSDLKRGRTDRLLPFDLLDSAGDGETWALDLWWEYEAATKGRRAIEWSRCPRSCTCGGGSFRRHLLGSDEATDEDLVTEDTTTEDTLVLALTEAEWLAVCARRSDWRIIEAAPLGAAVVAAIVRECLYPPG